jgi:hypothetical protein
MSGGIFEGYPFTLNIKCIIFSLIIMLIYTYKPPVLGMFASLCVYFIIFVISYVSLAWYDYYYNCSQLPLQRGSIGITHHFKPPVHDEVRQKDHMFSQEEIDKNSSTIYAMHLLLIAPLLLYIGYTQKRTKTQFFYILTVLAIFTMIFHGGRLISSSHHNHLQH